LYVNLTGIAMFEYTITEEPSCKCVIARGRIDALSAGEIQNVFNSLILEGGRMLLADLSSVHYISSAGLRIFIATQKQLKKVGGELLLAGLSPQVLDVFKVSGFDQLFRMVAGPGDIPARAETRGDTASPRRIETGGVSMQYIETDTCPGRLFLIGSTDKMEGASYTKEDVVQVSASDIDSGCGLAALGDSFDDYSGLFGEAMVIRHNFFYYPAVRHPSVDFLQNAHANPKAAYQFLHGFGFNGENRYILSFQTESGGVDLASLIAAFLAVSRAGLIGVTLLAESKGIRGMQMKKPPLSGSKPSGSEGIFSARLFPDWFDFPVEPAHTGAIVAATGIAARHPEKLPQAFQKLFSGENPFHLHAGIFDKAPIKNTPQDFESELTRVFNELGVYKVQHLLGQSRFACGLAGITELEV
jgi:anti-anti-sigma factor